VRSSYTVSVRLEVTQEGVTIPFERTWSFTTLGRDPDTRWAVSTHGDEPPTASAISESPAPVVVTATRPATGETATQPLGSGDTTLDLGPGTWQLCADQAPEGEFEGFHDCRGEAVAIGRRLKMKLGKRPSRRTSSSLVIPVTAPPELAGQPVTATITRYKRSCKGGRCKQKQSGAPKVRTLVGAASFTVKVPRPAARGSTVVTLAGGSFQAGDVPCTVASVTRRYSP
jgi:hypothetical protein